MVAVKEFSWEEVSSPDFSNPARVAWREAVAEIAAKAHEKLPECNGRVDSAVKIVLAGDVELLPDGTAQVASQSNGSTVYHIVNGHCDCRDYEKAPHNFCKHRLSAVIVRRAQELVAGKVAKADMPTGQHAPAEPPTPLAPLPEAPASANCHITIAGRQVQVTLRDTDETRLLTRLAALLQQYPMAQPPPQPPVQGTAQPVPDENPYCHTHKVALQKFTKEGRTWYSHKTAEGSWCKGK